MKTKRIPEHIQPVFNEANGQWGLFNSRLQQWIGKDEYFEHAVFASPQEAKAWYRTQI